MTGKVYTHSTCTVCRQNIKPKFVCPCWKDNSETRLIKKLDEAKKENEELWCVLTGFVGEDGYNVLSVTEYEELRDRYKILKALRSDDLKQERERGEA